MSIVVSSESPPFRWAGGRPASLAVRFEILYGPTGSSSSLSMSLSSCAVDALITLVAAPSAAEALEAAIATVEC